MGVPASVGGAGEYFERRFMHFAIGLRDEENIVAGGERFGVEPHFERGLRSGDWFHGQVKGQRLWIGEGVALFLVLDLSSRIRNRRR